MGKKKINQIEPNRLIEQGKRLERCLERANMKQCVLAEKAYYSSGYISELKRGAKGITSDNADRFAPILGVRREYLLLQDDYMTFEDMISGMIGKREEIDAASFGLLDALGYRFGDVMQQPDGSHKSMHRPYSRITINKQIDEYSHDDTDAEILEKAHDAPPVRYYVVTAPDGERFQVEQEDFMRIIDDISDFARFRIQQARQHYFRHR